MAIKKPRTREVAQIQHRRSGKAGEMYKNALDKFSIDKDGQDMFDEITKQLRN